MLAAARQVFIDRGLEGASIEAIAAAAGVTRPVVYEHFESKYHMFRLLVAAARAELNEVLATAVAGVDDDRERLQAGIAAVFDFMEADRRRWSLLFDRLASSGEIAVEQTRLRNETVDGIAALIGAAAPSAAPLTLTLFAHALSGAAEQMERWWRDHPHVSAATMVEHLVDFAWPGLEQLTSE